MQYKIKELTEFSDTALHILWQDRHESIYLYEDLRSLCPCAGCSKVKNKSRNNTTGSTRPSFKREVPIRPLKIEKVGHYAIRFYWSDGHNTGIYTFVLLRNNCSCDRCKMRG